MQKKEKIEKELDRLCLFSETEKEIILGSLN